MVDQINCCNCKKTIHHGDLVYIATVVGLKLCADCSPTWSDMLANHASYSCGLNEYGHLVYLSAEDAKKLADEHIAKGGALTDKFGLRAY